VAIVVVGGHSRNVGKTSVVAGLIRALPAFEWTAFKVTQFGHGRCSVNGKPCQCATADHAWAITEEKDGSAKSDSSRFLLAGARRSFWVRTREGNLSEAMPAIRRRLDDAENSILESNSILRFIEPDLYLSVLDPGNPDFKSSAREFLGRADAVLLSGGRGAGPLWPEIPLAGLRLRPQFAVAPPDYLTPEVVEFVRARLRAVSQAP